MQLQINAPEIKTVYEQQLSNGRGSHVSIYSKTEDTSRLHQHDYYESTLVLTRRYYQEINGKRVLLECGDFVLILLRSRHQSFYDSGVVEILNVDISKRFFGQYCYPLLPFCPAVSQAYRTNDPFLAYIGTVIASLNFRESRLDEFVGVVTFYIANRLRHHHEEQMLDDIPQQLKTTVETMHDKQQFNENALGNMVYLPAKSQEYLTRAIQCYYSKTPMQIINEICINFAKKQLGMTDYPATGIAYESGYSSPSLFVKTFRKLTSFTSNSYHKKLAELNRQILFANNPFFIVCPK